MPRTSLLGATLSVVAAAALTMSAGAGAQAASPAGIASPAKAASFVKTVAAAPSRVRHILAPDANLFTSAVSNAQSQPAGPRHVLAGAITCTTPAVAMYHVDGLAQLRRWGFGAPTTGTPGWTQQEIGSGWGGLNIISGGDGVIYTIDQSGQLHWYSDGDYAGGGADWNPASGTVIGSGWGQFTTVVSGGNGVFYAVDSAGDLRWYRYLGTNGSIDWAPNSGAVIGQGWNTPILLAAGGSGVLFTVSPSGTMTWLRHLDPTGGSAVWADNGVGQTIGTGWTGFTGLASMGGGVLMARDSTGNVWWYRDNDPLGGTATWANGGNGTVEGTGWSNAQLVTDIDGCTAS